MSIKTLGTTFSEKSSDSQFALIQYVQCTRMQVTR